MANPLIGMGGGTPMGGMNMGAVKQARQIMNTFMAMKNPQQALMAAAQQDPQLGAVMQMVGGRNPKDVFYEQCKKQGIDPNPIINALKG